MKVFEDFTELLSFSYVLFIQAANGWINRPTNHCTAPTASISATTQAIDPFQVTLKQLSLEDKTKEF